MYAKKGDEQGPRSRGRSFDSVHEEKQLNNEVSGINVACVLSLSLMS